MRSRRYLLTTVSSLAILGAVHIVSPAVAADMPVKAPVAPAVAAAFNWSGFYIGLLGGGAWLDHKQRTAVNNGACGAPLSLDVSRCDIDASGGTFGGMLGFNMQSGRFVYGIEADASWTGLKKSKTSTDLVGLSAADLITATGQVDWLATVRGRIGIAMSPTLLYVTGGVAFGGVKSRWHDNDTGPGFAGLKADKTSTGWVAGAGIEHAFAGNWSLRLEGLYHDLGKVKAGPFGSTYNTTFYHRVATARAGLALRW